MDEINAAIFFVAILGSAYAVYKIARRSHHDVEHAQRIWQLLATRLDGRYERQRGFSLSGPGVYVVAEIDGVSVTVMADRAPLGEGRALLLVTKISAEAAEVGGLELCVYPEDTIAQMTKILGAQDLLVGDEAFDERFVIKANNEDLARAWLDEEIRRCIEACHPYHFSLSRGEIRATRAGLEQDVRLLETTVRSLVILARGGQRLLAATRAVAAELGGLFSAVGDSWAAKGGVLIILERLKTQVLIDFVRWPTEAGPERLFTRARARPLLPTGARFLLRGRGGCPLPKELESLPPVKLEEMALLEMLTALGDDAESLGARLTRPVVKHLEGLRPELVAVDGREVTVCLAGLVLDVEALQRAIELAVELGSAENAGPYR